MNDPRPSDEILNAFVDGEFSPEDRLLTLKSIAANENLSREVCDMYQLKELVSMAYRPDLLPDPDARPVRVRGRRAIGWKALAASLVVGALGAVAILEVTREQPPDPGQVADASSARMADTGIPVAVDGVQQVLLHVTDIEPSEADALFDDIEFMFETAWLNGQNLEVQVVVHGTAMDLVRADRAPFPDRIRDLVQGYSGLRVTACGQSRARHERQEGRTVELLPWVEEVESGVREAAQKQSEGWTYIRV